MIYFFKVSFFKFSNETDYFLDQIYVTDMTSDRIKLTFPKYG